jgi:hypothetical protein
MPSRRKFLSLALGSIAAISGCISPPVSDGNNVEPPRPPSSSENGKTRGEADPITVEETITDPDDEYVPSNDTVRYPATMSGGEVDEYRYISFENWADVETLSVAEDAVESDLRERFDDLAYISVSIGKTREGTLRVGVIHQTLLDGTGNVISAPDISVSKLVEATPQSVTATVHLAGKSATRTYPVIVYWDAHVPFAVQEENDSE